MDNRVFDVSKPHHSRPHQAGKPVIVGHHPEIPDPMLREHVPDKPLPAHHFNPAGSPAAPQHSLPPTQPLPPSVPVPPVAPVDSFLDQPRPDSFAGHAQPGAETPPAPDLHSPHGLPGHQPEQLGGPQHASWHPETSLPIPAHHGHLGGRRGRRKLPLIVLALVVALAGTYALIDAGVFGKSIDLPFHIFKQDSEEEPVQTPTARQTGPTLPAGFTNFRLNDTDIAFAYPQDWGAPTAIAEPGFTKRGGTEQSTGTYAYLISFATNKDIQIAITSSQYLPTARTPVYYDFQNWCIGTADGKFYKELLRFTRNGAVDEPTTVACDQGPLADAAKVNDTTIVQAKTTNPDGSALGDLYTMNLSDTDLPVIRIKDSAMTNGEDIKTLLATIKN